MNEKIYCKDCRFCDKTIGTCHRNPPLPMFDIKNNATGHPFVFDNDWCGMAERREGADPKFVAVGKVEADDAIYVIARDELKNMKEENKEQKEKLEEAVYYRIGVNRLLQELRSQCGHFNSSNFCCRWSKKENGSYHDCENIGHCRTYKLIMEYARKDVLK